MSGLSVVIPVWGDYQRYLSECLTAVHAEGVVDTVIIVDNASATPIEASGEGIRIVRSADRLSAGAARNLGLGHVETEFVCFADVDDRVMPDTWSFLLDRLRADDLLVACAAQLVWWNENTGQTCPATSPRPHVYRHLSARRRAFAAYMLLRMALPTTTATIFRTRVAREAGGFGDSDYAEDWAFAAAVALRGPVEQHRRPGALVRLHAGSLVHRAGSRREYEAGMDAVRARVQGDPRAAWWMHALMPAVAAFHRRKAGAMDRKGEAVRPLGVAPW